MNALACPFCVCTRCGIEKPETDFNVHRGRRSGLQAWCRQCKSTRPGVAAAPAPKRAPFTSAEKTRKWRTVNPEKARAADRAFRAANIHSLRRRDRETRRCRSAVDRGKVNLPEGFALVRTRGARERLWRPWPVGTPFRAVDELVCHFHAVKGFWVGIVPPTMSRPVQDEATRILRWKGVCGRELERVKGKR